MIEAGKLKKGNHIMRKGEPYRIKNMSIVVTSKHSHTKAKIDTVGLFSGTMESFTASPHEKLEEIEIIRKKGQLISKGYNNAQVMDLVSYEVLDAEIGEELVDKVKEGDEVTFVEYTGKARVIGLRT